MGGHHSHHHHHHHHPILCGPCHTFADGLLGLASHGACHVVVSELTGECEGLLVATFMEELSGVCALIPVAGEYGCEAAEKAGRLDHWEQYVKQDLCKHLC